MKTTIKLGLNFILLLVMSCKKENTFRSEQIPNKNSTAFVTDYAPGKYSAIQIGTQKWMAKNLEVSRYRNGDKIPQVTDPTKWAKLTTGAWCWYNNDSATGAVYGKLYNWYAVKDPRGLAPEGWHIPGDAEWATLTTYLGLNAGGKLKDTGTIQAGTGLWHRPNAKATNKSGFTALPGGFRDYYGIFYRLSRSGSWASSSEYDAASAWGFSLYDDDGQVVKSPYNKREGFSVRCVED